VGSSTICSILFAGTFVERPFVQQATLSLPRSIPHAQPQYQPDPGPDRAASAPALQLRIVRIIDSHCPEISRVQPAFTDQRDQATPHRKIKSNLIYRFSLLSSSEIDRIEKSLSLADYRYGSTYAPQLFSLPTTN